MVSVVGKLRLPWPALLTALLTFGAPAEPIVPDRLASYFPYGVYVGAETITEGSGENLTRLGVPFGFYYQRVIDDLAKHHVNLICIQNTSCYTNSVLVRMLRYGESRGVLAWLSENISGAGPDDSISEAWLQHWAAERIAPLSSETGLLAWSPIDEPLEVTLPKWQRHKAAIESADPNHPVIAVTHGGPKGFEQIGQAQACDRYPVMVDSPGVWSIGPFVRRYTDVSPVPVWFVVQAFEGEGRRAPTPAELRLMTYAALAEGAKGIAYFSYTNSLANEVNSPGPLWDEIGALGRVLVSLGPDLVAAGPVARRSRQVIVKASGNGDPDRPEGMPPADHSLVELGSGRGLVVVYNTSRIEPLRVLMSPESSGKRLCDLTLPARTGPDPRATQALRLRLEPGDGRVLLLAAEGDHRAIAAKARERLSAADRNALGPDLDVAANWGIETADITRAMERDRTPKSVKQAAKLLGQREGATPAFWRARRSLDGFRRTLDSYHCLVAAMYAAGVPDADLEEQRHHYHYANEYLLRERAFANAERAALGDTASLDEEAQGRINAIREQLGGAMSPGSPASSEATTAGR